MWVQVETPVLQSVAGGADADPFVTYHNSLDRSFTLRISTELHLKRLIVGGFERVFEIGRIFRNEGISTRHNPEFTSIELYQAYADYTDMMRLTEELVKACVQEIHGGLKVTYGDREIDFSVPFKRVSMADVIRDVCQIDLASFSSLSAAKQAVKGQLQSIPGYSESKIEMAATMGHLMNEVFETAVEDQLWQPTIVMDYPVEVSPLAKMHRTKPGLTERFELFIAGRELANSFTELTDPLDQRQRFEEQSEQKRKKMSEEDAADPSTCQVDYIRRRSLRDSWFRWTMIS